MRPHIRWSIPAVAGAGVLAVVASGLASQSDRPQFTPVPSANVRAGGFAPASRLGEGLRQIAVARGSTALENPQGIVTHYGYENDVPSPDDPSVPQMVPASLSSPSEAQKTEPDKNTYLVLDGHHYLFQGHENGAGSPKQGYLTRIDLDAGGAQRVTLLATHDADGNPIAPIDGSTWDPWAQRLLLTTESASAPTYAATATSPSTVTDVSGALGRGGYEGICDDGDGNLWIVEDVGGPGKQGTTAKQPNSYLYRYVPARPGDLGHGRLQALQVRRDDGTPVTWQSQSALMAPDQVALHSYGRTFATRWVTIHDTATDGDAPFGANALAKAAGATPFKRPENGAFRPGTGYGEFVFTETGDTNATSPEDGDPQTGAGGAGGWGSLFRLRQSSPSADSGQIEMLYRGNEAVSGLDNVTFLSADRLTAVEDAGDTLHAQRDALDSGYVWSMGTDYAGGAQPARWLAEGRDASATLDAANGGFGRNEGDNEITGVLVSDGDPGPNGVLGAKKPNLADPRWRWFYTQQHGDNVTYEVLAG